MEYIVIGICIAVIAALIILRRKPKAVAGEELSPAPSGEVRDLSLRVEMLPPEAIDDESKLVEITDSSVLARVSNLVPNLAQAGNAASNAVQAVEAQKEVLYRVIIPPGAELAKSREMEGAFRAFYHNADGIRGHANIVAAETHSGAAVAANTAAAAIGVASVVVGQYYMTQINAQLGQIGGGISKISDFQNNEYRSRVFSLLSHVKTIAEFQADILENDELRLSKIAQLDSLEKECTKLLGQANLTLAGFANKTDLDFDAYEKALREAQNWYIYQNTLLEVLCKLSDLRFALHLGAVSREQCTALLPTYTRQVEETQNRLVRWHQKTTKRLSVDTAEVRRKRGGLDRAIHFIPGLINDDWNFRSISEKTADMIDSQVDGRSRLHPDSSDLYAEEVQLISKDGKVYYLPSTK